MPKPAPPNRGIPFHRQTGPDAPQRREDLDRPAQAAVLPELAAGSARGPTRPESDPELRAHQRLGEAERQAQALLAAARQKAARVTEEAIRDGRLQGQAEGRSEARASLQALVTGLTAAGARLQTLEETFRTQAPAIITELALAVAGRLCRAAAAQEPAAILETVREALALLPEPGEVTVRIHPDHFAILQDHWLGLSDYLGEAAALQFLADPAVEAGGCIVEAAGGLVDATLAGRLEEARRRMLGETG